MNKYFKFYYLDSLLMFILTILVIFNIRHDMYIETFLEYMPIITYALMWVSGICFFFIVLFHLGGYKFYEIKELFPKYYLLFFIIVLLLGIIYNYISIYSVFNVYYHDYYYYSILYIGYSLLTIYTLLGFKKDKKKNK